MTTLSLSAAGRSVVRERGRLRKPSALMTLAGLVTRSYDTADLPTPRTQLLSNGTYSVMVTSAGGGYSRCGPLA